MSSQWLQWGKAVRIILWRLRPTPPPPPPAYRLSPAFFSAIHAYAKIMLIIMAMLAGKGG